MLKEFEIWAQSAPDKSNLSGEIERGLPYYRKLTLHEIKALEINATEINANLMENDFRIKKINAKEEVEFHNEEN